MADVHRTPAWGSATTIYLAYLLLLLGFASLGMFVAALATRSGAAAAAGGSLIVCFTAAVTGFRSGARQHAGSSGVGGSVWSAPLRRDQITQYVANYRGGPPDTRQPRSIATVDAHGVSASRTAGSAQPDPGDTASSAVMAFGGVVCAR